MQQGQGYCHLVISSAELGGGDLVGLGLAAELRRRGQRCPVWVPARGPVWERARQLGLNPNLLGSPALLQAGLLRPLLGQWRLARRLRRNCPGLVHVHSALTYGALSWGLGRSGLARVVHLQIEVDDPGLCWALKRPPELILTCARFLVDRVRACLPPTVQQTQWIEALPNAVDTERFFPGDAAEARAKVGAPPLPLVLMLANLAAHKGQETAVRAVAELKRRGIDVACWLAGEERGGTDRFTRRLRALIDELGVADRVRLLGFRDDAPELLRAADVFLLPSTHEGLPLTVLEAQASKVPVLASATAGIPEAVQNGETGFLIPPHDIAGYADGIVRLLNDANLRRRVSEQAYARTTREYNWRGFCARVEDLYQELLTRRSGPGSTAATAAQTRPRSQRRSLMARTCATPKRSRPWHERFPLLGWFRNPLRNVLIWMARGVTATDDGRDILVDALDGVYAGRGCRLEGLVRAAAPYPGLGEGPAAGGGAGTIFITGRFRCGSTPLWNLFRHVNGFTAYYEPYNERRWFDPATRGSSIDPTHRNVTDYWKEYEGLHDLGRFYREEWTRRNLVMGEEAWDADLLAYTRLLLERAAGRAVLQCNRIDFRLPWVRRHFPAARVVHLYRHPRDSWFSALTDLNRFPPGGTVEEFRAHDHYYLLGWCRDLKHHFPFLDERGGDHPYQLYYYLWKLSYLFGRRYAHHSLAMEELVERPEPVLRELFGVLEIDPAGQDMRKLKSLVVRPELGKWRSYAGEEWFQRHEAECEAVLEDFLSCHQEPPLSARRNGKAGDVAHDDPARQ